MLNSIIQTPLTIQTFLLCTATSIFLGILSAFLCKYKNHTTQSFFMTIAILPVIIQLIIMLVNGNIGAGVAVAGTFSLIRFRSAPGTAREITAIFLTTALGLATGMGYLVLAMIFFLIVAVFQIILYTCNFGAENDCSRDLRITIPEDLDYEGIFDDIFDKYTKKVDFESVKTTNLGTLYEIRYTITLKQDFVPKKFLDELRIRNGNLNIVCGRVQTKEAL